MGRPRGERSPRPFAIRGVPGPFGLALRRQDGRREVVIFTGPERKWGSGV